MLGESKVKGQLRVVANPLMAWTTDSDAVFLVALAHEHHKPDCAYM